MEITIIILVSFAGCFFGSFAGIVISAYYNNAKTRKLEAVKNANPIMFDEMHDFGV